MLVPALITCQCKASKWELCKFLSKLLLLQYGKVCSGPPYWLVGRQGQIYAVKEKDHVRFFWVPVGLQCLDSPYQIRVWWDGVELKCEKRPASMCNVNCSHFWVEFQGMVGLEWSRGGQQDGEEKPWGSGALCLSFTLSFQIRKGGGREKGRKRAGWGEGRKRGWEEGGKEEENTPKKKKHKAKHPFGQSTRNNSKVANSAENGIAGLFHSFGWLTIPSAWCFSRLHASNALIILHSRRTAWCPWMWATVYLPQEGSVLS